MYQALYRKYRPKTFKDVVGQQNITETLVREVVAGKLSHAYLFTGSRGTGKTTCAKILAKAVNCLNPEDGNPCNKCEICKGIDSGAIMDVVEIDAASNNGVDNIRELIDETNFTPVQAKKRVYIIDEVHMLSAPACNAFLKTLEEPREHVIFILATTDPHKLLVTVRSRCQRFDFRRIGAEDIENRLKYIAGEEVIDLEDDAAVLIARIVDGSLRDAVSILDLCSANGNLITAKTVGEVAGLADKSFLFDLTHCIKALDAGKALELINELHSSFSDMDRLCSELINHIRSLMIIKTVPSASSLIVCTKAEYELLKNQADTFTLEEILYSLLLLEQTSVNLTKGVNKRTELEIALIKLCSSSLNDSSEALFKRISALEKAVLTGFSNGPSGTAEKADAALKSPGTEPVEEIFPVPDTISLASLAMAPAAAEKPTEDLVIISRDEITVNHEDPVPVVQFSIGFQPTPDPEETPLVPTPAPAEPVNEPLSLPGNTAEEDALLATETGSEERTVSLDTVPGNPDNPVPEDVLFDLWPAVLKELLEKDPGLWGFLNSSKAFIDADELQISLNKADALEAFLKAGKHMEILKETVLNTSGKKYQIVVCEKKISKVIQEANLNGLLNRINELSDE